MSGKDYGALKVRTDETAHVLRVLGNSCRLRILCTLAAGETNVTDLCAVVGISQSAMSQHLARLRASGMVATRRNEQTIFYRLAGARTEALMESLHRIFCDPPETGSSFDDH